MRAREGIGGQGATRSVTRREEEKPKKEGKKEYGRRRMKSMTA